MLGTASASYVYSWEGYTSTKGDKYSRLKKKLQNATINEILAEYNSICFDKSWNTPLRDLFSQEIKERILSDATFFITTVWRSLNDWLQQPYVIVQLGFDEIYPVIDLEGEALLEDDPIALYVSIPNNEFSEETQRQLIELLLTSPLTASVKIQDAQIQVVSIGDFKIQEVEPDLVKIPITIYQTPDLHLLYILLENLRKKNDELINVNVESVDEEIESSHIQMEVVSLPPVEEIISKLKDKSQYPALWNKIHLTALKCNDLEQYSKWIWDVCKNLPCSECKYHMLRYIQAHSPSNLVPTSNDSEINIAFYWSWQFHNEVNIRLGKPIYPYEKALEHYSKLL